MIPPKITDDKQEKNKDIQEVLLVNINSINLLTIKDAHTTNTINAK